jgi:hypothetical protein
MNKAPGQPLGGLFFGGHPFIVISDNYLSATVVSYQKKDCGSHFVSYFLHGILSIPTSAATAAAATACRFPLYVFSFLLCPEPLFTLHTTPNLCWCLSVCFHSRLWGLGTFHHIELSRVIELSHVVIVVATPARAPQLPKSPPQQPAVASGKVLCVYLTLYLST